MKNRKREAPARAAVRQETDSVGWAAWGIAAAALLAVFWAYSPSMHGPFIFDDLYLPFSMPGFSKDLIAWLRNVRPVLMFTYWMNMQLSGGDPFSYHVVGVLIHIVASVLVYFNVRRLLEWAERVNGGAYPNLHSQRTLLAGFAAALFLLHPAQTEAVAYIAGRSEALSVTFALAAMAVLLYRTELPISWGRAVLVLALFGLGVLSKENMVVVPALLLLTDYWWTPGFSMRGVRDNWRLYVMLAGAALFTVAFNWNLLKNTQTAGFHMKDLNWYEYLFTQFRALWVYVGEFFLPVRLTADWDFSISRSLFDHGSIFGLLAWLAVVAAAWHFRKRFPLATYGIFFYLLAMSPTSSVLPIRDPVAERRLYFSILGLLLVVLEGFTRWRMERKALATVCAAVVLLAAVATHARAEVWSSPIVFWKDTAQKSPRKSRPQFHLAYAYYHEQQFPQAVAEFEKASLLEPPAYGLLVDWALALNELHQPAQALEKLRQAAALEPSAHVYSQIGMIYAQQRKRNEAMDALATAERLDPNWAPTFNYRAKIFFQEGNYEAAVENYKRALALNPNMPDAQDELQRAIQHLRNKQ